MRRLEFEEGSGSKFWEVALAGTSFDVTFGKIGTSGQSQTKTFATAERAQSEHDKLVKEKLKKGYVEVGAAKSSKAAKPLPVARARSRRFHIESAMAPQRFASLRGNSVDRVRPRVHRRASPLREPRAATTNQRRARLRAHS